MVAVVVKNQAMAGGWAVKNYKKEVFYETIVAGNNTVEDDVLKRFLGCFADNLGAICIKR